MAGGASGSFGRPVACAWPLLIPPPERGKLNVAGAVAGGVLRCALESEIRKFPNPAFL
jgi:hypothetical protein